MSSGWLVELFGLGALLVLLLLPGLLAVRAHWTTVPLLSSAFWALSWWLPDLGAGRKRFLLVLLMVSAGLVALRLLRQGEVPRPGWPALTIAAAALLQLAPVAAWPVAPGHEMSFQSLRTLSLVWRDGIPRTLQPLLAAVPFGGSAPGLPCLAADVSLVAGLGAARSTLLVSLASFSLLQLALYGLLSHSLTKPRACLAALTAQGLAMPVLGVGAEQARLALAFVTAAAAVGVRGRRWPSAVAGGCLVAAGMASAPDAALMALLLAALAAGVAARRRSSAEASRLGLALATAVFALGPVLWGGGLRFRGLVWDLSGPGVALGLALAVALATFSLRSSGPSAAHQAWALGAVALVLASGSLVSSGRRVLLEDGDLEAMTWLRDQTPPLAVICIEPGSPGVWIPALAGRAVSRPYLPAPVAAWPVPRSGKGCSYAFRHRVDPAVPGARLLFRKGHSEILAWPP